MKLLSYVLTRKLTNAVLEKAAQDGMMEDNSRRVRQVSIYQWSFWLFALLGLLVGGACWIFHQPKAGLVMFLLFEALAVPGLCIQYNCLLTYNEEGFTWRNLLRISHRYSYEEVTGLYQSPLRVVVELNDHKRLDLDPGWVNREQFAKAVCKYRSQKPPKLAPPVVGMSNSGIAEAYENGVFARAMLVKKDDLPQFARFKRIHYCLCALAWLFAIFAVVGLQTFQQMGVLTGLFLCALPGILCMAVSLALYFRYPQYFTTREPPSVELLPKQRRSIHKRCTNAMVSLLTFPGGIVFFLAQLNGQPLLRPLLLAAAVAVLLFVGLLSLFRRYSWEYRKFRIGYVSFAFCQVLFCLPVFFTLAGLFASI